MYKNITLLSVFFILQITISFSVAADTPETIRCQQNRLIINAKETRLGELIEEIYRKCQIEIFGMGGRDDELITFSSEGDKENVLKRLLRHLKEDNYAFEYSRIRLVKVSVVSNEKGKAVSSRPPVQRAPEMPQQPPQTVNAVKVQGVVAGTQAESLGLMEGDIIVDYDGVRINHAQQLVSEVKNREKKESVDITVIRDRIPMRFSLKGGMIGVHITTAQVPKEEVGE